MLSARAKALLFRVQSGKWYPAFDDATPVTMQELVDAGLVVTQGRVKSMALCYVPKGTTPLKVEKYPAVTHES